MVGVAVRHNFCVRIHLTCSACMVHIDVSKL